VLVAPGIFFLPLFLLAETVLIVKGMFFPILSQNLSGARMKIDSRLLPAGMTKSNKVDSRLPTAGMTHREEIPANARRNDGGVRMGARYFPAGMNEEGRMDSRLTISGMTVRVKSM
jgi:hypothetical protein